jgi:hypothetical protein
VRAVRPVAALGRPVIDSEPSSSAWNGNPPKMTDGGKFFFLTGELIILTFVFQVFNRFNIAV